MSQLVTIDTLFSIMNGYEKRLERLERSIRTSNQPIDFQRKVASDPGSYHTLTSGNDLYGGVGNTDLMRVNFTPSVDCWWVTHGHFGIVDNDSNAYEYAYTSMRLSVSDVDGITSSPALMTQRNDVNKYGFRSITHMFKLAANTTYYVAMNCPSTSGGAWQHYASPSYLFMWTVAFAR